MVRTVSLDNLRVLAVTGTDRVAFLQGQLTQDVKLARPDVTVMTGWADAKGRLLFAGHLFTTPVGGDEALALLVPAEIADTLLKRLRLYVLRAKVLVTALDVPVTGLIADPAGDPAVVPGPPAVRLCGQDARFLQLAADASRPANSTPGAWQRADIRAGLPGIVAATAGEFVPQMVNLDLLDGISFNKGCYTGQEIVARMKYLGRVKRRMLRFASAGAPRPPGAPLFAGRGAVGQVVSSAPAEAGHEFLAVVVLDDLPGPLFLDEALSRPVQRLDLPYEIPL